MLPEGIPLSRNFMHCELVATATWSDVLSFESVKWHDEKHGHKYSTHEVLTDDPQMLTSEAEASSKNSCEKLDPANPLGDERNRHHRARTEPHANAQPLMKTIEEF